MKSETKCIKKSKSGRFQVSLLEINTRSKQPEFMRDYAPERRQSLHRVAIQFGKKLRNGDWDNQTIYCDPDNLADLQDALAEFTGHKDADGEGKDEKSSPSSDLNGILSDDEADADLVDTINGGDVK